MVKYGKREHMRALIEHGRLRIAAASEYDRPSYNEAVRDKEREFEFQGIGRDVRTGEFVTSSSVKAGRMPEDWFHQERYEFANMFNARSRFFVNGGVVLKQENAITIKLSMRTDYRLFCMSKVLHPSLFSDFDADACVIVDIRHLLPRLCRSMTYSMPRAHMSCGDVDYQDSLGAYASEAIDILREDFPTQMVKAFRYAYQKEFRVVWTPRRFEAALEPVEMEIGSLKGFASLLELP